MAQRREGEVIARGERRWMIRWSLGRDEATGRYRAKTKTIRGTRRDAERELRRIQRSRDTGGYCEPSKETLNAFLDRWLESSGSRVSPRTLADYTWLLKRYVRPHLGHFRLEQIRPLDVQEMLGALEKQTTIYGQGRKGEENKPARTLSPRTIRLAHAILGSALKQAVRWELLHRNPADYVDLPRQERREMQALTAEQVATLREQLAVDSYAPLFDFLIGTGARPGEALALRWQDLDLEEGRATIRRALTKVDGKPAFKGPKTAGSRRAIPLPSSLVAVLREHRKRQAQQILKLGAAYDREAELVFANEAGGPLDLRNVVNRHFKPALERAKLSSTIRLYDLRHTHATALLAAGVHPKVAAERLGHSSTRQTLDTYSHVLPGMQEEATRLIEESLFR